MGQSVIKTNFLPLRVRNQKVLIANIFSIPLKRRNQYLLLIAHSFFKWVKAFT